MDADLQHLAERRESIVARARQDDPSVGTVKWHAALAMLCVIAELLAAIVRELRRNRVSTQQPEKPWDLLSQSAEEAWDVEHVSGGPTDAAADAVAPVPAPPPQRSRRRRGGRA